MLKVENAFRAGNDITINAHVDSFFKKISQGNEYSLRLESINSRKIFYFTQPVVRVVVPDNLRFQPGEKWSLSLRIKPVYGKLNESGFDKEAHFLSQGWHATGRVQENTSAVRLKPSFSVRLTLYNKVSSYVENLPHKPLLLALSFGVRNEIAPETWDELKSSGLVHLMAISGLHVGIAYLIGWKLGASIRRGVPVWFYAPPFCALMAASAYTWLAGFSIPTLRALTMCLVFSLLLRIRVRWGLWHSLLTAMALLLALDPFSALSPGFWLSFGAVATIFIILRLTGGQKGGVVKKALLLQLLLNLLMIPLSVSYFYGFSLFSLVYNFLFVPWFSVLIIPALFVSMFCSFALPGVASYSWLVTDMLLFPAVQSIKLAEAGWLPAGIGVMWLALAILILMLVKPLAHRKTTNSAAMVLLALWIFTFEKRDKNWTVSVLDVGHGLAVVIQRMDQVMLYDTGGSWENGSIAKSVITPVLTRRGIEKVGILILSHTDRDHSGGKPVIEEVFMPERKLSSQILDGYHPCIAGERFEWQELEVRVLWPPELVTRAYNPHSCVIRVSDGSRSVLLTGDIDGIGELILANSPADIESDIMLVPHHGSRTSSTGYFISAVNPELAVSSGSKGNQWNLPSDEVIERYRSRGVSWLDTGSDGQIDLSFTRETWAYSARRHTQSLSWYRQILRKGVE